MLVRSLNGLQNWNLDGNNLEGYYEFVGSDMYIPLCAEVAKFIRQAAPNEHVFVFDNYYYVFVAGEEKLSSESISFKLNFTKKSFDAPVPTVKLGFFDQWFIVTDPEKVGVRAKNLADDHLRVQQVRLDAEKYKAQPMKEANLQLLLTAKKRKKTKKKMNHFRNTLSQRQKNKFGTGKSKVPFGKRFSNRTISRLVEIKLIKTQPIDKSAETGNKIKGFEKLEH